MTCLVLLRCRRARAARCKQAARQRHRRLSRRHLAQMHQEGQVAPLVKMQARLQASATERPPRRQAPRGKTPLQVLRQQVLQQQTMPQQVPPQQALPHQHLLQQRQPQAPLPQQVQRPLVQQLQAQCCLQQVARSPPHSLELELGPDPLACPIFQVCLGCLAFPICKRFLE